MFGKFLGGLWRLVFPPSAPTKDEIRGQRLLSRKTAQARADKARPRDDPGFEWGGVHLPSKDVCTHLAVLGSTGSGKSLTLQGYMKTFFARIVAKSADVGEWQDNRALVYDPKSNLLSTLAGMRLRCPVKVVNPFDDPAASVPERGIYRGVAWDMARDITDSIGAASLAQMLFPVSKGAREPFFETAAVEILKAVVVTLNELRPGRWRFADVIRGLDRPSLLTALLRQSEYGQSIHELYCSKESTFLDVLSTIANKAGPYREIASAWEQSPHQMSLTEWVEDSFVLVLGNSHLAEEYVCNLNRLILAKLTELLLDQPGSHVRRTYVVLDELRLMGQLEGSLDKLANLGRSVGVSLCIAAQSIEGLTLSLGSKEKAEEVLGQCSHKAFLRMDSNQTAEFAAKQSGEYEVWEKRTNETTNPDGRKSVSVGWQPVKYTNLLYSDFLDLPKCDLENGLHGAFRSSSVAGTWRAHIAGEALRSWLVPEDPLVPNLVLLDRANLRLRPWSNSERLELGLPPEQDQNGKSGREGASNPDDDKAASDLKVWEFLQKRRKKKS